MVLTKQQEESLVSGYTRQNYLLFIPLVIVKIIEALHDEYFRWTIKGDELVKFRQARNGQIIYPKSCIKINDIKFELRICPNGWKDYAAGSIQCFAEIKYLPDHVANVTFYTEIGCITIPKYFHSIINKKSIDTGIGWSKYKLKLSEINGFDEICFYCKIQLQHITFKNNALKSQHLLKYHIDPVDWRETVKFVWKIDKNTIKKLISLRSHQNVFSPLFANGIWGVRARKLSNKEQCRGINGNDFIHWDDSDENKSIIQFQLGCFKYPENVHWLNIDYKIQPRLLCSPATQCIYDTPTARWVHGFKLYDHSPVGLWTREEGKINYSEMPLNHPGVDCLNVYIQIGGEQDDDGRFGCSKRSKQILIV